MLSYQKFEQFMDVLSTWRKGPNSENTPVSKGLRNLGNTCFLNSVLQAMSSCPQLLEHLKCVSKINKRESFTKELFVCLSELRNPNDSNSVNPRILFKKLVSYNRNFEGNDEQDVLEAFESMLSCLQEENSEVIGGMRENKILRQVGLSHSLVPKRMILNPQSLSSSSCPLSNPFEGWMCSHLRCQACSRSEGDVSHRWMPSRHQVFTTIPLPIPNRKSNQSQCTTTGKYLSMSLHSCLEEFFKEEELAGVTCSACSAKSTLHSFQRKHTNLTSAAQKQKSAMKSLEQILSSKQAQKVCEGEMTSSITYSIIEKLQTLRVIGENDSFIQDFESAIIAVTSPLSIKAEISKRTDLESSVSSNSSSGGSPTGTADIVRLRDGSLGQPSIGVTSNMLEMMFLSLRQQVRSDAVKYSSVSRLPELLCLYLCRRVYDEKTGRMRKRSDHIEFPLVLHMDSYCSANGEVNQTPNLSPNSIFASAAARSVGQRYSLRAVVEHQGNEDTGHYVAYCLIPSQTEQEPTKRRWELFSDACHKEVTEDKVLSAQATMLFYDKIHC